MALNVVVSFSFVYPIRELSLPKTSVVAQFTAT